jgi:hypothetical protein
MQTEGFLLIHGRANRTFSEDRLNHVQKSKNEGSCEGSAGNTAREMER